MMGLEKVSHSVDVSDDARLFNFFGYNLSINLIWRVCHENEWCTDGV
jgi:hypothetical protein